MIMPIQMNTEKLCILFGKWNQMNTEKNYAFFLGSGI